MLEADDDFARVIDGLVAATLVRAAARGARPWPTPSCVRSARPPPTSGREPCRPPKQSGTLPRPSSPSRPDPAMPSKTARDDGGRCTTLRRTGLDGRWRCLARDVAAAYALDQYVDVCARGRARSRAGPRSGCPGGTGLRARVQPVIAQIDQRSDGPSLRAQFEILLEGDPGLDAQCRIAGPDGTQYALSIVRAGRAAEPLCAEVVRIDAF